MSFPHLGRGAINDFMTFLRAEGVFKRAQWNSSSHTYFFPNGSKIEFFSLDNSDKVHGPARDYLFINECQFISFEIFNQLDIRTRKQIFLDFNPTHEFWAHKRLKPMPETAWIHTTYKDNAFLTEAQIRAIESRKDDKDWWEVYGLGLVGGLSGKIFPKINYITKEEFLSIPSDIYWGYDDGFVAPFALVAMKQYEGAFYFHECFYLSHKYNSDKVELVTSMVNKGEVLICDSASPDIIAEFKNAGLSAQAVIKNDMMNMAAIAYINEHKIYYTSESTNMINEANEYRWQVDNEGELLPKPVKKNDHLMDAKKYVCWWAKFKLR